jgi:hypothetical protein
MSEFKPLSKAINTKTIFIYFMTKQTLYDVYTLEVFMMILDVVSLFDN